MTRGTAQRDAWTPRRRAGLAAAALLLLAAVAAGCGDTARGRA